MSSRPVGAVAISTRSKTVQRASGRVVEAVHADPRRNGKLGTSLQAISRHDMATIPRVRIMSMKTHNTWFQNSIATLEKGTNSLLEKFAGLFSRLPPRDRDTVVLTSTLGVRGRSEYADFIRGEIRRIEKVKFGRTWKGRDRDLLRLERELLWAETGK